MSKNYTQKHIGSPLEIGESGQIVKSNAGTLEHRNAADDDFAIARGADPIDSNDLVTKGFFDTQLGAISLQSAYDSGGQIAVTEGYAERFEVAPILPNGRGILAYSFGTDFFTFINADTLGFISSNDMTFGSTGGEIEFQDTHLTNSITLSESGEIQLDTASNSIVGAINELKAGDLGDSFTFSAGRAANITDSYLRSIDGVAMNQAGYTLPYDATIVAISVATDGVESWTAEVRKNNNITVISSLSVTTSDKAISGVLSVDVDALDELQFYCNGTNVNQPVMTVWLKRR